MKGWHTCPDMRILLVEDELKMARAVRRGLEEEGYAVDAVSDGEDALHRSLHDDYDAIVLDRTRVRAARVPDAPVGRGRQPIPDLGARVGRELRGVLERRRRLRRVRAQEARGAVRSPVHTNRAGRGLWGRSSVSMPIRARLTMWYVGLLAVVFLVLGGFLILRLHAGLIHGLDDSLATRAAQISLGLQGGCEGEFQGVSDPPLVGLPPGESRPRLPRPGGKVLESAGDPAAEQPFLSAAQVRSVLGGAAFRGTVHTGPDAEAFRTLAVAVPSGACSDVIVVATSTDEVGRSVRELVIQLSIGVPIALLVAGIGGWWLARRALAPVARMTREADTIGIERLDERIDVPRASDEVQRLAVTLNAMLDRLERGVEDKKRFAAEASHQPPTP